MEVYKKKQKLGLKCLKQIKILLLFLMILYGIVYKKKFESIYSPKISIFLPIYNKANYLKKSIGSIQIQTIKDIEIIAVNDCSEDNTLEVLKEMEKKDKRIKIINNDKNRGLLYSRAMGILNSKGKYLMNLDPDDEFKDSDNLEYLYKIANKLRIDVISFGFIKKNKLSSTQNYLCSNFNIIYYQPEIVNSYYKKIDYLIWNKFIKKDLFLKAYEIFKEQIYAEKWNYNEDEIWSALIYNYANSMICVNKTIYIYNINNDSLKKNKYNILYLKNLINWIEMFTKIFNNKKGKIMLINRFSQLIKNINENKTIFLNIINKNSEIKNKYIKIFNIINNQFIFNNSILKNIIYYLKN